MEFIYLLNYRENSLYRYSAKDTNTTIKIQYATATKVKGTEWNEERGEGISDIKRDFQNYTQN